MVDWKDAAVGLKGSWCMFGAQLAARDATMPVPQEKKHNKRTSQNMNRSAAQRRVKAPVHGL